MTVGFPLGIDLLLELFDGLVLQRPEAALGLQVISHRRFLAFLEQGVAGSVPRKLLKVFENQVKIALILHLEAGFL